MLCWPQCGFELIGRVLSISKEVLLLGVAIAGVVIAAMGLSTWRKQLAGTARHDVAFKVLRSAIELRNALRDVRRVRMFRLPADQPPSSEESLQVRYSQHRQRIESIFGAYDRLQAAELDAAVLFGDGAVRAVLLDLYDRSNQFFHEFEAYYQAELERAKSGDTRRSIVAIAHLRTVYDQGKDDEFSANLEEAFERARAFFTPHLK